MKVCVVTYMYKVDRRASGSSAVPVFFLLRATEDDARREVRENCYRADMQPTAEQMELDGYRFEMVEVR